MYHEFIEVMTVTSEGRIALIQGALDDFGIVNIFTEKPLTDWSCFQWQLD